MNTDLAAQAYIETTNSLDAFNRFVELSKKEYGEDYMVGYEDAIESRFYDMWEAIYSYLKVMDKHESKNTL